MKTPGGSFSEWMVGLRPRWNLWSCLRTYHFVRAISASEGRGPPSLFTGLRRNGGRIVTGIEKKDDSPKDGAT